MKKIDISNISKYGIFVALISLIIFFSFSSSVFLSSNNIMNILRQVSVIGIATVGATFIILTGGIDLSVGSVIGVSVVLTAQLMVWGLNPLLASVISLIMGIVLGLFNGFVINEVRIPPLITTLGSMTALRGLAYLITDGLPVFGFTPSFQHLAQDSIFGIPIPVVIMVIIFLLGYLVLHKTIFGRHVYGVGGNEEAARLSGVNVKSVKYAAYAIAGFTAALAGVVLLSRINSGQPQAGTGYEMDIITAVVLGGVSITGGEGKVVGTIVGVLIMGVLANGMILLNVGDYYQMILKGAVLLVAVGLDQLSKGRTACN